jgi:flagellum-specific peptidoglycan hydrolase FlgJ
LKRKHYEALFKLKKTDYKGWAKGLQKAGYATDKNYPAKLIELIERYKLYRFDELG